MGMACCFGAVHNSPVNEANNPDIIPSKANTVVLCYIGSHPSPKKNPENSNIRNVFFIHLKKRYLNKILARSIIDLEIIFFS